MAGQSNFTPDEWRRVVASPIVTGIALAAADSSGPWGLLKETVAGGSALLDALRNAEVGTFIKAVADDLATPEGRKAAWIAVHMRFERVPFSDFKSSALAELRAVAAIIDAKAPEDAVLFKSWLRDVAQVVAQSGVEGGFLGFGGVAVSDAEKTIMAEVSKALNLA